MTFSHITTTSAGHEHELLSQQTILLMIGSEHGCGNCAWATQDTWLQTMASIPTALPGIDGVHGQYSTRDQAKICSTTPTCPTPSLSWCCYKNCCNHVQKLGWDLHMGMHCAVPLGCKTINSQGSWKLAPHPIPRSGPHSVLPQQVELQGLDRTSHEHALCLDPTSDTPITSAICMLHL